MAAKSLYDEDFVRWTGCVAEALRQGRLDPKEAALVAMEIEDMGKRDQRAAENNAKVLIHHLLKWRYQPSKRSHSWKLSIAEHGDRLKRLIEDSPSLKVHLSDRLSQIYARSVRSATVETGLETFPAECPWDLQEILDLAPLT